MAVLDFVLSKSVFPYGKTDTHSSTALDFARVGFLKKKYFSVFFLAREPQYVVVSIPRVSTLPISR